MDRILRHLLTDFLESQELKSVDVGKDFEKFVNYSVISHEYNRSFDLDSVTVGEGDDTGIDGISIIVNGQIVESPDEIDFLKEQNNYLEATYIFIQSKASSNFDSSEMNNFAFGVKDFFAESPKLRRNIDIQEAAELSDHLLRKATHFRENPTCKLFYVTTGIWNNDKNNRAIIESTEAGLQASNLFSKVVFTALGANEISKFYRDTKNSISATFTFAEKITLPDLPDINEAYYGILPFSEFRKLLVDENDNLRNIFYDNVRDFQGQTNPINKTIAETIESGSPDLFTVLNNGVTVVATSLKTSGNKLSISDYQIVNGCQTSNVLFSYLNRTNIQNLKIPLKLIVTENDEVKNKITIATNSQTAIRREQLQAMTEFQKNLEHYYNTIQGDGRLHYERRTKQFQSDSSIVKARIITVQTQIKAFGSMFLEIPHRVTSHFGSVVRLNIEADKPMIFNSQHKFIPYYTAGLAFYRLDSFFRSKEIDTKYKKFKFFLLMLFRNFVAPQNLLAETMNSEKLTEKYCDPIITILNDPEKALAGFIGTTVIFDHSGVDLNDKQALKNASTTEKLLQAFKDLQKK